MTSLTSGYEDCTEQAELRQLIIPGVPTFDKGTSPDATVMAPGTYLPDGILPSGEAEEGERELSEFYPAYVSGQP